MREWPLIRSFGGQAFVDVRASLNSFLPASLPSPLASRLVDHAHSLLSNNPALRDKVEFELLPTCLDFDFRKWESRYAASGICSTEELNLLEDVRLFRRSLDSYYSCSL